MQPGTEQAERQLKDGLYVSEVTLPDGGAAAPGKPLKRISFSNRTHDRQFVCRYALRDAEEGLQLGPTAEWVDGNTKISVSVLPGDSGVVLCTGRWAGVSKTIGHGAPSQVWLETTKAKLDAVVQQQLQDLLIAVSTKGTFTPEELQALTEGHVARFCEQTGARYIDTDPSPAELLSERAGLFSKPLCDSVTSPYSVPCRDTPMAGDRRASLLPLYADKGRSTDACFAAIFTSLSASARASAESQLRTPCALATIFEGALQEGLCGRGMARCNIFTNGFWNRVLLDTCAPHSVSQSYADAPLAATSASAGFAASLRHLEGRLAAEGAPAFRGHYLPAHLMRAFPPLLEKAYAKQVTRGYAPLEDLRPFYGELDSILSEFSGDPVRTYTTFELSGPGGENSPSSFRKIRDALQAGAVCLATRSGDISRGASQVYSVLSVREITPTDLLILLRDPQAGFDACAETSTSTSADASSPSLGVPGEAPHTGPWGVDDLSACYLYREAQVDPVSGLPVVDTSGVFYMDFTAFLKAFESVHIGQGHLGMHNVNIRGAFSAGRGDAGQAVSPGATPQHHPATPVVGGGGLFSPVTSSASAPSSSFVCSGGFDTSNASYGQVAVKVTHGVTGGATPPPSIWVAVTQDGPRFAPKLADINLYVVAIPPPAANQQTPKCLGSATFSSKQRFLEVGLLPETAGWGIHIIAQPVPDAAGASGSDIPPRGGYTISLWVPRDATPTPGGNPPSATEGLPVEIDFLRHVGEPQQQQQQPYTAPQCSTYSSPKEVRSQHWAPATEAVSQVRGADLAETLRRDWYCPEEWGGIGIGYSIHGSPQQPAAGGGAQAAAPRIAWVRRGGMPFGGGCAAAGGGGQPDACVAACLAPPSSDEESDMDAEVARLALSRRNGSSVAPGGDGDTATTGCGVPHVASSNLFEGSVGNVYWEDDDDLAYSAEGASTRLRRPAPLATPASVGGGGGGGGGVGGDGGKHTQPLAPDASGSFVVSPITPANPKESQAQQAEVMRQLSGGLPEEPEAPAPAAFIGAASEYCRYDSGEGGGGGGGSGSPTPKAAWDDVDDVVTWKPRKRLMETMRQDNSHAGGVTELRLEVCIVSAAGLIATKGSATPFCEVKLRKVDPVTGLIGADHPNPQKKTTRAVANNLASPVFNEKFNFTVPYPDAVRISIFGKRTFGTKVFLGRVDLVSEDILAGSAVNGPPVTTVSAVLGDASQKDRSEVSGTLTVTYRILSVR